MRYIGNKTKLTDFLTENLQPYLPEKGTLFDMFAGTGTVAKTFKTLGYNTHSTDILYFSYILQQAYLGNTGIPKNYENHLEHLNNLKPQPGFIHNNYSETATQHLTKPRKYFTPENATKIDTIRNEIEHLYQNKQINQNEYHVLLATLIEAASKTANITGIYSAYLKHYSPNSLNTLTLKPIPLTETGTPTQCHNEDSTQLTHIQADIYYLDPPYNQRQYAPNYHLLETIAKNDNPEITGITGMRNYTNQKSDWCNRTKALQALETITKNGNYQTLALSYNNEGIMPQEEIKNILQKYGKLTLIEKDYQRYKSNTNNESIDNKVQEQLYILEKNPTNK